MNLHDKSRVRINTMVPIGDAEKVRQAIGRAGAGVLGEYTFCSFTVVGKGRFMPSENASPHIGKANTLESVEEEQIQVVCDRVKAQSIITALKDAHPYEEVPIEIFPLLEEIQMTVYYEVKISAENQAQADGIINSLLENKLATGGQFINAPARFLWKGEIEDMAEYVTITSYTTSDHKEALVEDVRRTSIEEFPMVTFVAVDDLNSELQQWIDRTLNKKEAL